MKGLGEAETRPVQAGGLLRFGAGLALAALVAAGSFYNLAHYPTIWWDEAIFSETAANLVQHGRYAFTVQSPDELCDLDFRISAGPAVILPVALAYRLLGVGLVPGRLVAGAYLALAFLALYWGARRFWGVATALAAVALALAGTDVLHWGRSVLGDVPALGLFLGGLVFLGRGLESPGTLPLFLGGLFLGLAFDAKEFYALAFLPPLVFLAREIWQTRGRAWPRLFAYGLGVGLPLMAFLVLKAHILGGLGAAVLHFFQQKKLLCHEFFTPFTIGRLYPESLTYLLTHPVFWLGLLGGWWAWRREAASPGVQLWVANFLLWSLFYLNAVYWHRFALPALFLAAPLAAHFLGLGLTRLTRGLASAPPRWLAAAILPVLVMGFYPMEGVDYLEEVFFRQGHSPTRLVQFLRTHAPARVLIETPEYELAFLDDDHRIHLMPPYFFVESTPEKVVLLNPQVKPYDFDRVGADLLILGPFGKSVFKEIYQPARVSRDWRRIATVDAYDIYLRRDREEKPPPRSAAPRARLKLVSSGRPPLVSARQGKIVSP